MFKLLRYLFIIGMIVFSGIVSFTWDIPTDNQMGVFFLGLFMVFTLFYHVITDIKILLRNGD
jgi:hypothetical protein